MKESILFVDDDENLLQGLQRMLRSKRGEWEMTFISEPRAALELMQKQCFDVVVADMRMPEINGAELLRHVREICPRSVRIILSGQAELGAIFDSIDSAHQYLSKPCDSEDLKATIERASRLRDVLKHSELEQFISQNHRLPSQPLYYDQLMEELAAPQPSHESVANIVCRDMSMTAKLLQLVNSSFFGPKRTVYTVEEAVGILGVELLTELVVSKEIFIKSEAGTVSTRVLQEGNFAIGDSRFTEAPLVLRDIGTLILSLYDPERYRSVLEAGPGRAERVQREYELFGTSRIAVGAYLLGLWGIPSLFAKN